MSDREDPKRRLSVALADEHCEDGHSGKYEAYCYRCQYFEEVRSAAAYQLAAIEKRRLWVYPKGEWSGRVGIGDDEYQRRTLHFGRFVLALWRCRCSDCKAEIKHLRQIVDTDFGQADRAKNMRPDRPDYQRAWKP